MRIQNRKEVLTTGDVARICHVAPRTVSKWFDSGKLRGYRIPGSRDRRIPVHQLVSFMRVHGIPLDGLDGGLCRVMVLGDAAPSQCIDALNAVENYDVRKAANGFEAGVLAQQFRPHAVVLEASGDGRDAVAICRNIKATTEFQAAKVIAATSGLDQETRQWLLGQGFDVCLPKPFNQVDLAAAIEQATNLIT